MLRVIYIGGQIASQISDSALKIVVREVIRRNRVRDRIAFRRITRSMAARDHEFTKPANSRAVGLLSRRLRDCYLAHVAPAA